MVGYNSEQREVRQAFKFQLMRSKRTRHLDRTIDVAAHIWNHSVALDRRYYQQFGKSLKQAQLQKQLAKLRRTRFPQRRLVDSRSVQAVTDRLYPRVGAWFQREIQRPPTFRSRPKHTRFTRKQRGSKLLGPGRLRIQGRVYRFHQAREIAGTIQTWTIRRDATGRHFVSFGCAEAPKPEALVKTGQATGGDFGWKTLLALPTGEKIDSPLGSGAECKTYSEAV
jgi:putative transposase